MGRVSRPSRKRSGACEELRPYLRREFGWPLTELGRIRLRKGDIHGAEEAFLAAHQAGWDPQPGLALVRLAQGDVPLAAALIREALDHPLTFHRRSCRPIRTSAGRRSSRRKWRSRLPLGISTAPNRPPTSSRAWRRLRKQGAGGRRRPSRTDRYDWPQVTPPAPAATSKPRPVNGARLVRPTRPRVARMGLAHAIVPRATRRTPSWSSERLTRHLSVSEPRLRRSSGGRHQRDATRRYRRVNVTDACDRGQQRRDSDAENVFRREGEYWSVVFEGEIIRVRDMRGVRYLARLLASPGREFHVVDLVGRRAGGPADTTHVTEPGVRFRDAGDAGEMLDARAKEAYRRRLTEIEDDLEQARALGDASRVAQATAERDFLVARVVPRGWPRRTRSTVGSAAERARASVTRAVRQAMGRIRAHHPPLGAHLDGPSALAPTAPIFPTLASPSRGSCKRLKCPTA